MLGHILTAALCLALTMNVYADPDVLGVAGAIEALSALSLRGGTEVGARMQETCTASRA